MGDLPGFRGEYHVVLGNDALLSCPVCEGKVFAHRLIKLNTTGATLFGFDWANADSDGLACVQCGRLQEFVHGFIRVQRAG
jgi:hypothetical protein